VQGKNGFRLYDELVDDAGGDIVVETAVRAGENAKFFAKIDDVRRKCGKRDQKDNEKKGFSFMKQSRTSHE